MHTVRHAWCTRAEPDRRPGGGVTTNQGTIPPQGGGKGPTLAQAKVARRGVSTVGYCRRERGASQTRKKGSLCKKKFFLGHVHKVEEQPRKKRGGQRLAPQGGTDIDLRIDISHPSLAHYMQHVHAHYARMWENGALGLRDPA